MRGQKDNQNRIVAKEHLPASVADVIKVYERYQEVYAKTQRYLEAVSPKVLQTNSNQSFVIDQ